MNESEHHTTSIVEEMHHVTAFGSRHRLIVLIAGVVAVAMILVGVSMTLYKTSGTALLDLSLPGLQAARKQISEPTANMEFPGTGPINDTTLDQFSILYNEQSRQATGVDSFGGAALSDKALAIDEADPSDQ